MVLPNTMPPYWRTMTLSLLNDKPVVQAQLRNAFGLLLSNNDTKFEYLPPSRRAILESRQIILKYCGDFEVQCKVLRMLLSEDDVLDFGEYFAEVWFKDLPDSKAAFKRLLHKQEEMSNFLYILNREEEENYPYVFSIRCSLVSWNSFNLNPSKKEPVWFHLNRGTKTISVTGLDEIPTCLDKQGYVVLNGVDVQKLQVHSVEVLFGPAIQALSVGTKQGNLVMYPDPLLPENEWETMSKTFKNISKDDIELERLRCKVNDYVVGPCGSEAQQEMSETQLLSLCSVSSSGVKEEIKMFDKNKVESDGKCQSSDTTSTNSPDKNISITDLSKEGVTFNLHNLGLTPNCKVDTHQSDTPNLASGMQRKKTKSKRSVPLKKQSKPNDSIPNLESLQSTNSDADKNPRSMNDSVESSSRNHEAEKPWSVSVRRMTRKFKSAVETETGIVEPLEALPMYSFNKRSRFSGKKHMKEEPVDNGKEHHQNADMASDCGSTHHTAETPKILKSCIVSIDDSLRSLSSIDGASVHSWRLKSSDSVVGTTSNDLDKGFTESPRSSEPNANSNSALKDDVPHEKHCEETGTPLAISMVINKTKSDEMGLYPKTVCMAAGNEERPFASLDLPSVSMDSTLLRAFASIPFSDQETSKEGLVDSALVTTENYETSSEYEDSVCQNSAPPVSMEEGEVGKSSKGVEFQDLVDTDLEEGKVETKSDGDT